MANIDEYDFSQESKSGQPGFETFKSEIDGMYYFHFNDSDGKAVLFSESYPTEAARDNGVESVKKNSPLEERWRVIEENGKYYYSLKAGNHQEIARGFPFDTIEQLNASMAYLQGKTSSFSYASLFAPIAAAAYIEGSKNLSERVVDNYMVCSAYKGHTETPAEGFRTFYNENNRLYFFTMVDKDGEVILRSEGYPTTAARDNGLASVQKNKDIKERWSTIEEDGLHYAILKAGNHQEIGRSCPKKDKSALGLLLPILGLGIGAIAGGISVPEVTIPEVKPPVVEVPEVKPAAFATPDLDIEEPSGGIPKWLWWLLGLLLLGALLWWLLKGCDKPKVDVPVVDTTTATPIEIPVDTTKKGEKLSEDFAPVVIYFDNDQPRQNSVAYSKTYNAYLKNKPAFEKESDKATIDGFFTNDVEKGYNDLKDLTSKLATKLKEGYKATITVKAFASPVASNEYNKALTARRISSIMAELSSANGGELKKYIDDKMVTITEESNGEDSAPSGISDDAKNKRNSVYDIAPSKERRVEIRDVRVNKE
jgi:uncharacterized protein YegP (UPF0339 family)/outer membrane protein OmpA-like peptidoglycan-associated protein